MWVRTLCLSLALVVFAPTVTLAADLCEDLGGQCLGSCTAPSRAETGVCTAGKQCCYKELCPGSCSATCGAGTSEASNCFDGEKCCVPNAPATSSGAAGIAGAAPGTTAACPAEAPGLHLHLPCCITTGICTLDDIVDTGGYFANFITGLSAAFFFAAFVYGGAMYLISFGESKRIEAGKKAMTGAAYGMAIVLFAWTLVNYLANSLVGK